MNLNVFGWWRAPIPPSVSCQFSCPYQKQAARVVWRRTDEGFVWPWSHDSDDRSWSSRRNKPSLRSSTMRPLSLASVKLSSAVYATREKEAVKLLSDSRQKFSKRSSSCASAAPSLSIKGNLIFRWWELFLFRRMLDKQQSGEKHLRSDLVVNITVTEIWLPFI